MHRSGVARLCLICLLHVGLSYSRAVSGLNDPPGGVKRIENAAIQQSVEKELKKNYEELDGYCQLRVSYTCVCAARAWQVPLAGNM